MCKGAISIYGITGITHQAFDRIIPEHYLQALEFSLWCWPAPGMLQYVWEFHKHVF